MSQLVLVRHGQAAAFSEDSDRLTDLGFTQARLLGEHWVATGVAFDAVIAGSLRRHAQTEAEVAAAYARAGLPWPKAEVVAGWNEYDALGVMGTLAPRLAESEPGFGKLVADFQAAAHGPERNRYFQRMFEVVMARWIRGDFVVEGVESFAAFYARVSDAFAQAQVGEGSRRIAVFTSGGPVGVCVQRTLRAPEDVALEINWRVRNTSLTEFLFGKGRLSFDLFNVTPHLTDPALVSYR